MIILPTSLSVFEILLIPAVIPRLRQCYYIRLGNKPAYLSPSCERCYCLLFTEQSSISSLQTPHQGILLPPRSICACVCVNLKRRRRGEEGGGAHWMTEGLWSRQSEPISRRAPRILSLNWLDFPVSAAGPQCQLGLSENEPGPQRGEAERYRQDSECVAASNYLPASEPIKSHRVILREEAHLDFQAKR